MCWLTIAILSIACNRKISKESRALPGGDSSATAVLTEPTLSSAIPACIKLKMDSLQLLPVSNPPAEILKYLYNGDEVFVISANCCDQYSLAFDENCTYVCAPSGGFMGKGDGKCRDFFEKAKLVGTVWKDNRKRN